ncbi:hypothetical protein BFJ63_vAg19451, partial [Fusarium oxysporum f. sp. narcissi]
MTISSCGKPVSYCDCTIRQANIGGVFVSPTSYNWCHGVVPDDRAIYMGLKDHVEQLKLLTTKRGKARPNKNEKKKKKNGSTDVVEALQHLPYHEDIKKLYDNYGFQVVCSSARVLMNIDTFEKGHLSSAGWEDILPTAEPDSDVPKEGANGEAAGGPEQEPANEKASPYDHPCEPKVAAEEDQGTKDAESIATEEEYVEVEDMEERLCEDDFSAPDYDGYREDSAGDEPAVPEVEADRAEVYEVPAEDATTSNSDVVQYVQPCCTYGNLWVILYTYGGCTKTPLAEQLNTLCHSLPIEGIAKKMAPTQANAAFVWRQFIDLGRSNSKKSKRYRCRHCQKDFAATSVGRPKEHLAACEKWQAKQRQERQAQDNAGYLP